MSAPSSSRVSRRRGARARQPARRERDLGRRLRDPRAAADRPRDEPDEGSNVQRDGPAASTHDFSFAAPASTQIASRVPNGHGLHLVAPVARDEEHRHVPQPPGDVVHEDVLRAEDERRADDRVREARLAHDVLRLRLAAEVRERRLGLGVRDADVHDAPHARAARRVDEPRGVLDRPREGRLRRARTGPSTCCRACPRRAGSRRASRRNERRPSTRSASGCAGAAAAWSACGRDDRARAALRRCAGR